MKVTFYKDYSNRWYVQYPEWEGDREELEMIAGADVLCDILAQGENSVTVFLTTEEPKQPVRVMLVRERKELGGYAYKVSFLTGKDDVSQINQFEAWLCHVTKHMLGSFPERIYIL